MDVGAFVAPRASTLRVVGGASDGLGVRILVLQGADAGAENLELLLRGTPVGERTILTFLAGICLVPKTRDLFHVDFIFPAGTGSGR